MLTKALACAVPLTSSLLVLVRASLSLKPLSGLTPVITGLGGAVLSTTKTKVKEGLLSLPTKSSATALKA